MNLDSFSWPAKRASIRDDTSKSRQIHPWFGYQGRQPGDEIQRLEDDMGGAIPVGRLELVTDLAIGGQRQAFFRHCWTADVPAEPFQLLAFIRPRHHGYGKLNTHWRTGCSGKTSSTSSAALSAMRRAPQLGQKPRCL